LLVVALNGPSVIVGHELVNTWGLRID
jgi:hypothetical protein